MMPLRFLLVLLLLTLGCTPEPPPTSESPTNGDLTDAKRNVEPSENPQSTTSAQRVVALSSLSAHIMYRLDNTRLVGVSSARMVDQNPEFDDIPRVSGANTPPNLEAIVALKPDLVIGTAGFHDQPLSRLAELGIDTLAIGTNSWESLEDIIRTHAAAIQADPEPLIQQNRQCLPAETLPPRKTLVLLSRQPLLSPTQNSWPGDFLNKFNGENLVNDVKGMGQSSWVGYVTLSPEKILELNPEILLLVEQEAGSAEALQSEPFWQDLQAVKAGQVYTVNYYGFVNPASLSAIAQVCEQLKQIYAVP
jgi:iron complex transport system substrate-binding protein